MAESEEIKAIARAWGGSIETIDNRSVVLVPQSNGTVVVIALGGVAVYADADAAHNRDRRQPIAVLNFQPRR